MRRYSIGICTAFFALGALASGQERPGFHELFDGETLKGWVTQGGRYDGKAVWTVEEGAITGRQGPNGAGGLIYTERPYHSFELELEAWVDYPFDSGIFLRMAPRPAGKGLQVTLDYRPGGEVGGIYADGWLQHNPEGAAKFRRDAWNHLRLRCIGETPQLWFWLNGELLTEFKLPAQAQGYAPTGLIGLQVHGGRDDPNRPKAQFRGIRIRELPVFDTSQWKLNAKGVLEPTVAAVQAGWTRLFNGRNLAGWEPHGGDGKGFEVRDGVLSFLTKGGAHDLRTRRDFRDFDLRFDFKIARMANSGLFLRASRTDDNPAYSGCELQILDDFNWEAVTKSKLKPWQFTGSLYGSVPPGVKNALYPVGTWNTMEVRYQGTRIRCELNGNLLYDVDTLKVPGRPFAERAPTGFIGFQRHAPGGIEGDAYAWLRNIYIRELEGK